MKKYNLATNVDTPDELNNILNQYKYGIPRDGGWVTFDESKYRNLSPEQFESCKIGTCWDYAEYEGIYFKTVFLNYKLTVRELSNNTFSLYFMQQDNTSFSTHTWLAYMKNGKVKVIESAWRRYKGVHEYDSEEEMLIDYVSKLNEEGNRYILLKYKPIEKYGLTGNKWLDVVYEFGHYIHSDFGNKVTLPELNMDNKVYSKPMTEDEIKKKATDRYKMLLDDPAHHWRATTGIELIHKEPTLAELNRIWNNWNKMSKAYKKASDAKSRQLFDKSNEEHYKELVKTYESSGVNWLNDTINGCFRGEVNSGLVLESNKFTTLKKKIGSMSEFCKEFNTVSDVMEWYKANDIEWCKDVSKDGNPIIHWPETILKTHKGICFDHAYFVHKFCKAKSIANNFLLVFAPIQDTNDSTRWQPMCHVVNIFEDTYGWYAFDYKSPKRASRSSELFGPFSTAEELSKQYLKWYEYTMKSYANILGVKTSGKKFSTIFTDTEIKTLESMEDGKYDQGEFFRRCPDIIKRIKVEEISNDKVPTWFDEVISYAKKNVVDKLFSGLRNIFESTTLLKLYDKLNESTIVTENTKSGINRYKKKYKNFDDFCKDMSTPIDVLNWVKINNCVWPEEFNERDRSNGIHFYWPDDILKYKVGTCIDFALFMHFFCERKHIENCIIRLAKYVREYGDTEYQMFQHFVCAYKDKSSLYYVFNYKGHRTYGLEGPYNKPEEIRDTMLAKMGRHAFRNSAFGRANDNDIYDIKYFGAIQDPKEYKVYDKFYGDRRIFRDDMMFKSKYMPSIICKYDSPNPQMHNDIYDNLKEKIAHLPKSLKAKFIYAASNWFNAYESFNVDYTNESTLVDGVIKPLTRKEYPKLYDGEDGNHPFGYFVNNKMIGAIRVTYTKGDDFYGLSRFIVDEKYRHQGIGRKLINFVIDKYGKYKLLLNVATDNTNAMSLYKQCGFGIIYTNNTPTNGEKYHVMARPGRSATKDIAIDDNIFESVIIKNNGGIIMGTSPSVNFINIVNEEMCNEEILFNEVTNEVVTEDAKIKHLGKNYKIDVMNACKRNKAYKEYTKDMSDGEKEVFAAKIAAKIPSTMDKLKFVWGHTITASTYADICIIAAGMVISLVTGMVLPLVLGDAMAIYRGYLRRKKFIKSGEEYPYVNAYEPTCGGDIVTESNVDGSVGVLTDLANITTGEEFNNLCSNWMTIKNNKSNPNEINESLENIKRILVRCFGIEVTMALMDTSNSQKFYGFNIYPSLETTRKIVSDVISNDETDNIKDIWKNSRKWHIDIDSKLFYDYSNQFNPGEITAIFLYCIEQNIFNYNMPVKVAYLIHKALTELDYRTNAVAKSSACVSLYMIPFICGCAFVNFKTTLDDTNIVNYEEHIKRLYESALKKIVVGYGTLNIVNSTDAELDDNIRFIMLWIFEAVNDMKYSTKVLRLNLKNQIIAEQSNYIRALLKDIFFKFSAITNKLPSMEAYNVKMTPDMEKMNDKIIDERYAKLYATTEAAIEHELLDKYGNCKKISQEDIDVLLVEVSNIETTDDKIYLLERLYKYVSIVDNALDMLNDPKTAKRVKVSKSVLTKQKETLGNIRTMIIKANIAPKRYGLFIKYPEGYEG